jgi:hypothetical protein
MLRTQEKYTVQEVKAYLHGVDNGERTRFVMAHASRINLILNDKDRKYFRGREKFFDRMPFVLFHYLKGEASENIARQISYLSSAEDVEYTIEVASHIIIRSINRRS